MKKKRISFAVVEMINVLCVFMLVSNSNSKFIGIEFSFNLAQLIFSTLSFVTLFVLLQNYESNLFNESKLAISIRINNRYKLAAYEVLNKTAVILIYEVTEIFFILLASIVLNKQYKLSELLLLFVFMLIVKLFYLMLLLFLQICLSKNYGFIVVCLIHLLLTTIGTGIYQFLQDNYNASVSKILKVINVLNISNYMSLERVNSLVTHYTTPITCILFVILIEMLLFIYSSKKIDILRKD